MYNRSLLLIVIWIKVLVVLELTYGICIYKFSFLSAFNGIVISATLWNLFIIYWTTNILNIWFFIGILFLLGILLNLLYPNQDLFIYQIMLFILFWQISTNYWSNVGVVFYGYLGNLLNYNTQLTNRLNVIHPFILYISIALVAINSICSKNIRLFKLINYSSFIILSAAIILGSWWAEQEGTWGGWWAWDPSEVLSLVIIVIGVLIFHLRFTIYTYSVLYYLIVILFTFSAICFYTIQLGFNLTSHNFGEQLLFLSDGSYLIFGLLVGIIIFAYSSSLILGLLAGWYKIYIVPLRVRVSYIWSKLVISLVYLILVLYSFSDIIVYSISITANWLHIYSLFNSSTIILFVVLFYINIAARYTLYSVVGSFFSTNSWLYIIAVRLYYRQYTYIWWFHMIITTVVLAIQYSTLPLQAVTELSTDVFNLSSRIFCNNYIYNYSLVDLAYTEIQATTSVSLSNFEIVVSRPVFINIRFDANFSSLVIMCDSTITFIYYNLDTLIRAVSSLFIITESWLISYYCSFILFILLYAIKGVRYSF